MLKKWIKYLCDPIDKTNLEFLEITKNKGNDVISGTLKSKSGHMYKIRNGVPILINNFTQPTSSVESFAYEWNTFDFDFGKNGWIQDIVKPVIGTKMYFKNKIIVDCGAGSGRQSLWMAEAGAKFVFSLELSNAAQTITQRVAKKLPEKIFVIQCDISHIPINIKKVKVNLVYCVNVVQHTKDPMLTISELSSFLSKKSDLMFNAYLKKGRDLGLWFLSLARRVTIYIPRFLLMWLTFLIAGVIHSLYLMPFIGGKITSIFPLSHNFKSTWLDCYDLLGSHKYQLFFSEAQLSHFFVVAKLKVVKRAKYVFLMKKIFS